VADTPSIGTRDGADEQGLTWLSASTLAEMIARREVSSVDVVRHFLDRIEEHDGELRAFRKLDPAAALAQAERADQAMREGSSIGRLHGVPVAFKESFGVGGLSATRDGVEVERVRAAGAVIVGVTVAAAGPTPDMADPTDLPRNPWNTDHTAGGSSAGNGAAVAGGLIPLAIGDDGGGSVRVPAAFCGLLGLVPTRGRIPHVDYRSAAPRASVTVGPMTRSVEDAALALQLLAGPDGRDYVCLQDDPPDYLAQLDAGIAGLRFLWSEHFGFPPLTGFSESSIAATRAAALGLESAGGTVEEHPVGWEDPQIAWMATQRLIGPEMAALFDGLYGPLSEADIVAGLASRERNWRRFRAVFAEYDFVISPTVQITAPTMPDLVDYCARTGDDPRRQYSSYLGAHTMLCNVLGLPAISIPAGFEVGMPIGLQVIGRPGSEKELLQVAQAFLS
jgi:Asp-tRNA(Asn)/Glu-tRNA(Gln) amidotransferase A subunit family amidase